jgi:membrane-associated protein
MDLITHLIDMFLHLDTYLAAIISQYGIWTYGLLFFVIFMETGFVVTPFLPGDSLLFAAGAFASPVTGEALNIYVLVGLLTVAAVLGDTANYWIGHFVGERAYGSRWVKKEYIDRTHAFFEKHGGKTIFLARFVPIIRTFAPFVAGVGKMSYGYFFSYNVVGGMIWVPLLTLSGYFFGTLPFVQKNFEFVIIAIILISLIPVFLEAWKARQEGAKEKIEVETP